MLAKIIKFAKRHPVLVITLNCLSAMLFSLAYAYAWDNRYPHAETMTELKAIGRSAFTVLVAWVLFGSLAGILSVPYKICVLIISYCTLQSTKNKIETNTLKKGFEHALR